MKSLLYYLGFRPNGGPQELQVDVMDPERHSISVRLPADQISAEEDGENLITRRRE